MKIVQTPHDVLLKQAHPVEKITKEIQQIIADMKVVLKGSSIGIGLAAPQVGISLQIFLAAPTLQEKRKTEAPIYTFINPKIISLMGQVKKPDDKALEGCLSIPDVWGPVSRNEIVKLQYMDETGKVRTRTFNGIMATIVQHEGDHLNGTLFTHRAVEQNGRLFRVNKETEKLEEIEM